MNKIWMKYVVAYGMWAVFIAVGLWFLIISRTSLLGLLNLYYVQGKFQRGMEVQFIDKAYLFLAALTLLILLIIVEEYLKHGAQRGDLLKRLFLVFGPEILFMFIASLASAILAGFTPLVWLVLGVELAAGVILIWIGARLPGAPKHKKRNMGTIS